MINDESLGRRMVEKHEPKRVNRVLAGRVDHSDRSASSGSILIARPAGTNTAANAMITKLREHCYESGRVQGAHLIKQALQNPREGNRSSDAQQYAGADGKGSLPQDQAADVARGRS